MKREERRIPIVVGAIGHRDLRTEDLPVLREAVRAQLDQLAAATPHAPHVLLTNLAEGSDMLCAQVALDAGWELAAALPFAQKEYEKDFAGEALEQFRALLAAAQTVFVVPETESVAAESPAHFSKDFAYRQAGLYLAVHSHVLLALWDGGPGTDAGCGTAEMVSAKLENAYRDARQARLHPADGAVIRIAAPRVSRPELWEGLRAGEATVLGNEACLKEMLEKTEAFDREAAEAAQPGADVFEAADALSVANAKKRRRILALLAVAATLLTTAFLLYDEASLHGLIVFCGAMILCLFALDRIAKRLACHERYLEYRVLAETLRVQIHLDRAGAAAEPSELLPWTLQTALPWVRKAAAAAHIGPAPEPCEPALDAWIRGQKNYHEKAGARAEAQAARSDRIVRVCLVCAIALYLAALVFEIGFAGLFGGAARLAAGEAELARTVLKIVLGALSAATLFAGNYYGKLSLEETAGDHRRMAALYAQAEEAVLRDGETPALLRQLAEEALDENGSWYAYQSIRRPDISL